MSDKFEVKIPATVVFTFYKLEGDKGLIEAYCKTMSSKEITKLIIDEQTGVAVTKGDDYAEAIIYDMDIEVSGDTREKEVTEMDDDQNYKK